MKTVTQDRARWIMEMKPGSKIETRDGADILLIPEYDFDTDETTWIERKIVATPTPTKPGGPMPGDTFRHETGASFKIADLPSLIFGKVVKREDKSED